MYISGILLYTTCSGAVCSLLLSYSSHLVSLLFSIPTFLHFKNFFITGSPIKLFTNGIAKLEACNRISEDFYALIDDSYGIDFNAPVPTVSHEDNIINIQPVQANVDTSLLGNINFLCNSDSNGIDIYAEVLRICLSQ